MVCVNLMDMSITGLRVFREVVERGTLTAAADALGYTQSAVSRQIATLEHATGAGVTTVPPTLTAAVPAGVSVKPVGGEPRRMVLARLPQPLTGPAAHVVDALRAAAAE